MIGLDSYSRQMFIYWDPILIYISLWIDWLYEIRKIAVCFLWLIAGRLQGHWWGFISRNYVVWPTFSLMNVFIVLKGSHFWFYIYVLVVNSDFAVDNLLSIATSFIIPIILYQFQKDPFCLIILYDILFHFIHYSPRARGDNCFWWKQKGLITLITGADLI